MKKKCKVVMLPTEKAENFPILKNINGRGNNLYTPTTGYYYTQSYLKEQQFEACHLHIISDEEIKVGDWCIDKNNCIYKQETDKIFQTFTNSNKIIATTDKSLELPEPSPEFIDKFIREYNKGNVIEEVMVEYEEDGYIIHQNFPKSISPRFYLKVDKNNYITIIKVKDSWSREEVEELVGKARDFGKRHGEILWNKWVEENL